jgi:hypothetical protein
VGKHQIKKNYKEIDYTMNCDKSNIRKMNLHVFYLFSFPFFIFLPLFFCSFSFLKSTRRRSQTIGQVNLYFPISCSLTGGTLTEGAVGSQWQPEGAGSGGMAPTQGWCSALADGQVEHRWAWRWLQSGAGVEQRRRDITGSMELLACEVFTMLEVTSSAEAETAWSRGAGAGAGHCLWKVHPPTVNQARAYPVRDFIRSLPDCFAGSLIGVERWREEESGRGLDQRVRVTSVLEVGADSGGGETIT